MKPNRPSNSDKRSFLTKLKNLKLDQRTIAYGIGIVVAIFVLIFIYFIQTPEFPEDIPSPENRNEENLNYLAQQKYFDQYARYVRKKHGSLLVNKELNRAASMKNDHKSSYVIFLMEFTLLDEKLFFATTNQFATISKTLFKIRKRDLNKSAKSGYAYIVDFLKEGAVWIRINVRYKRLNGKVDLSGNYQELIESQDDTFQEPTIIAGDIDNPRIVIIIDDLGNNMESLERLLNLDYELTYSIMPQLTASERTAQIIHEAGRDIMLHLPMQPKDWPKYNPGPGALMNNDTRETLRNTLVANLQTVPFAVGSNNHMGSAFTQYKEGMELVMEVLSERDLLFLDSKTAPGAIAKNSARKFGVTYLERNIFLDNVQEHNAIATQLYKGARIAKTKGIAILIGHPYVETYEVLAEQLPVLERQGVQIVGISTLIAVP